MSWPPELSDHVILSPWRPVPPEQLEDLRAECGLGPCEAMECIARSIESGKRELVTVFRPLSEAQEEPARERPADLQAAIARAQEAHRTRDRGRKRTA
jgi:hypothetical protein